MTPMEPSFEQVVLRLKQFAVAQTVDEEMFMDFDVEIQRQFVAGLIFRMKTRILTDDLPPEHFTARTRVTYEVPTSTWQMFKKRHAASWWLRRLVARWPVRHEADPDRRGTDAVCTFDLERYRAYPQAQYRLPDHFGPALLAHRIRDLNWTVEGDR